MEGIMDKEIDGKVYKDIPVAKLKINGKEVNGNIISAEDVSDWNLTVTIITEPKE